MDNTTETTVGELPDRALALILHHGYPVELRTASDARIYHPANKAARIVATLPPMAHRRSHLDRGSLHKGTRLPQRVRLP